jgi:hypothetical protein
MAKNCWNQVDNNHLRRKTMSLLKTLTEGIVDRDLSKEGQALRNKWEATGLLEGLKDETTKNGMSVLLENQAKQLLKEASSMAAGDVEGFAAVAFPIVRRVFGSLIANELVAVQPMSLPSGLIFFLDFVKSNDRAGVEGDPGTESLFGGGRLGHEITGGVDLTGENAERGFYNMDNGYTSATGSVTASLSSVDVGTFGTGDAALDKLCRFDPDLASGSAVAVVSVDTSALAQLNKSDLVAIRVTDSFASGSQVRRLSAKAALDATQSAVGDTFPKVRLVFAGPVGASATDLMAQLTAANVTLKFPIDDNIVAGNGLGSLKGNPLWGLEGSEDLPELDIKIDSVAVTAKTKKLKVKWTPELGQDLNAYHNLDAEVELTSIMSEQIALELDREILEDLIKGATAATYYWSRRPGRFLDRSTGLPIGAGSANESLLGADFTGNVSEWYETLLETVNDVSAQIHRKTLRGGANFLVCGPEVAAVLEMTAGFRAKVAPDADSGDAGAVNVGSISKKWDVYVDPYFPRNVILVGRRGAQFLESGFVYAPYVPLQVTPTIFGVEDFVPRKGVMTRYAKKMVRPDMYGLVIVQDLLG